MYKIMLVCHGNICRSPMAEVVLRDMLSERGLSDRAEVASSATSYEEIWGGVGNPMDSRARAALMRHGYTPHVHRAKNIRDFKTSDYDLILCMDEHNLLNLSRILPSGDMARVHKLLSHSGGADVADPWYSGNFELALSDIERGAAAWLDYLLENKLI